MVIARAGERGQEKPSAWNGNGNGGEEGTVLSSVGLLVQRTEKLTRIQDRTWAGMDWVPKARWAIGTETGALNLPPFSLERRWGWGDSKAATGKRNVDTKAERPVDPETERLRDSEISGPTGTQGNPERARHCGADPSGAEPSAPQGHGARAPAAALA